MSTRTKVIGGLLVLLAAVVIAGGTYAVTTRVQQVPVNSAAIKAIQEDRAARIAQNCKQAHAIAEAGYRITLLLNQILDVAMPPPGQATPEQEAQSHAFRDQTNRLIADTETFIARGDCVPHP